jgi:kinesin family protein 1
VLLPDINFILQITVTVTKPFLEYIRNQPIVFEVFGHYQQHPLHRVARQEWWVSGSSCKQKEVNCDTDTCCSVRQPPRRMQPPAIPISQPVRSPKFGALPSPSTSHVHAKYDVLVWFEICELGEKTYILFFYQVSR